VFVAHLTSYIEELQQQAGVFKRNANELKNKMWWKNMKVGGCMSDYYDDIMMMLDLEGYLDLLWCDWYILCIHISE
jgi:hypothetical protein